MTDALLEAIAAVQAVLDAAVQTVSGGGTVDLTGLEAGLEALCRDARAIAAQHPDTRAPLSAALGTLAATLDQLAFTMGQPVEDDTTRAQNRARALAAYRQPRDGY
ncbi:MAG: hypothetical protein P4M00_05115 [Azospirillaceae bacterium]|nr:hypothetical protein [Azospirillaceae bacterium]